MYEEISDPNRLTRLFEEYLDEYNMTTSKQMSLVFFKDHCEHLTRIVRVIRQPRGNALLVGVGGSGKQSLTRVAAAIQDCKCFQIEVAFPQVLGALLCAVQCGVVGICLRLSVAPAIFGLFRCVHMRQKQVTQTIWDWAPPVPHGTQPVSVKHPPHPRPHAPDFER